MLNNSNTNIERIIAKIDNDFNPDNSDWIPRVGAWCIDAMGMMNALRKEKKRTKLIVTDRIAYSNCPLDKYNIKVYDKNGCEIKKANYKQCDNDCPSTGEVLKSIEVTPDTISIDKNLNQNNSFINAHSDHITAKDYSDRYNIGNVKINHDVDKNYVIVDCDKIELNFDTSYIIIEQEMVVTETSSKYGCELPVIPNNALLIEALVYYCMYKMLCRGYKHPVFNLHASQYGTNPKYEFEQLKPKVERSIINNTQGDIDINLWWSAFYLQTFGR